MRTLVSQRTQATRATYVAPSTTTQMYEELFPVRCS
jgi:hypothetical protein